MEVVADPSSNKNVSSDDQKKLFLIDEIFSRLPKRRFRGRWTIHLGAKNYVKNYLCLVFLKDSKKNVDNWESQGRLDILSQSSSTSSSTMTNSRPGLDRPSSFMALFKTFKTNTAAVCELDSSKFSMDDVRMFVKRDSNGFLEQIQRSAWLCEYDEVVRHVQTFVANNHRKSLPKTISLAVRWILDRESEDQTKDSRRDSILDREDHHHRHRGLPQAQAARDRDYDRHHHRNWHHEHHEQRKVYRKHEKMYRRYQVLESSEGDPDENINHLLDNGDDKETCCVQEGDCDSCPGDDTGSFDEEDDHGAQLLSSENEACQGDEMELEDEGKSVDVDVDVDVDDTLPPPLPSPPSRQVPKLRKRKMSAAALRSRSVSPIAVISRPSASQAPPEAAARVVVPSSIRALPGSRASASHLVEVQEMDSTEQKRVNNPQKQAKTEPILMQANYKPATPSSTLSPRREQSPPTTIITKSSANPEKKACIPRNVVTGDELPGVPCSQLGQSYLAGNNLSENGNRGKMSTIQMIRYIRKRWTDGGMPRNRAFKRICAEDIPFKGMGGKRNEEIITAHDNYFQLAFRATVVWDHVSRIFDKWEDGEIRGQTFYEDTDEVPDMKITCWAKMQGITDGESDAIVPILKRVLSGELSLPQMAEKFTTYKIHRRMIEAFCKYLRCNTWDQCKKEYPTIANNTEFQKFVPLFAAHKRKRPRTKKSKTAGEHLTTSSPFPEKFTCWITNALKST